MTLDRTPTLQGERRWPPDSLGHVNFWGGHVAFKFTCPMHTGRNWTYRILPKKCTCLNKCTPATFWLWLAISQELFNRSETYCILTVICAMLINRSLAKNGRWAYMATAIKLGLLAPFLCPLHKTVHKISFSEPIFSTEVSDLSEIYGQGPWKSKLHWFLMEMGENWL